MREFIDIVETTLLELTPYRGSEEYKALDPLRAIPNDFGPDNTYRRGLGLQHFTKTMEDKGYNALGQGRYAVVFEHPGVDYVVKLFKADAAYLAYVKFALQNQDCPFVPKFRGKFMKIDDGHFVVRMEKLRPIDRTISREISGAADAVFYSRLNPEDVDEYNDLFQVYPGLKDFLFQLAVVCRSVNGALDLHGANVMARGAEPVLTDPIRRRA